ncbi:hypothetical protein [Bradyrhizobium sp. STM 3557]|uniref:hypothetical protein n=1 Tax=Bradyrhizobium sp. STM 3557 TaxID=578920 RepID=UPI00388E4C60
MHPVSASSTSPPRTAGFLLALEGFADEVCGTLARLFAYVGALALIGILGLALWQQIGGLEPTEPGTRPGWTIADDAVPAYALRLSDQLDRSATYTVLHHVEGGRKDVIRWGEPSDRRALRELEVYRFGGERDATADPAAEVAADLARRMAVNGPDAFEAAGVIDSKFGMVGLLRLAGASDGPGGCMGFFKGIHTPSLRISGWSCQGVSGPTRRAAVGCMLNRLTLLSTDHDANLSALFARAERKHAACGSGIPASAATDWVTSADDPRLRGAL